MGFDLFLVKVVDGKESMDNRFGDTRCHFDYKFFELMEGNCIIGLMYADYDHFVRPKDFNILRERIRLEIPESVHQRYFELLDLMEKEDNLFLGYSN